MRSRTSAWEANVAGAAMLAEDVATGGEEVKCCFAARLAKLPPLNMSEKSFSSHDGNLPGTAQFGLSSLSIGSQALSGSLKTSQAPKKAIMMGGKSLKGS